MSVFGSVVFGSLVFVLGLQLAACGEPQILYSEVETPEAIGTASRPVRLRIDEGFSPAERQKIMAAIAQTRLGAAVQLEVAALTRDSSQPGTWTVLKAGTGRERVFVAQRFPGGGGTIVVNVNRLVAADLERVLAQDSAAVGESPGS